MPPRSNAVAVQSRPWAWLLSFALLSFGASAELAGPSTRKRQLAVRSITQKVVAKTVQRPIGALGAMQYYGLVGVGKPMQEFRVVFDTSSGDMILPSTKCEDAPCESHRRFVAENSTSAMQIGWADDPEKAITDNDDRDTRSISLFGADVSGELVRDNVCVGSQETVCGIADFVVLTEEPDEPFANLEFDGIVGLSSQSSDAKQFNLALALLGKQSIDKNMFSLYLAPPEVGSVSGGELMFGGFDADHMSEDLHWSPVSVNGTWQVLVDDIAVDGKAAQLCPKTGCQAAVETGASLVMTPGNMLYAIMGRLSLDDQCSHESPSLGFIINGKHFALEKEDYLEQDKDGCRLLLASVSTTSKTSALILGYPFLRKFYSVFDIAKNRVGFALAKPASSTQKVQKGVARVPLVGVRP